MKKIKILVCTLLVTHSISNASFNTMSDLKEYAALHQEFPKADNDHWGDPDYTSYHRSLNPSYLNILLQKIGFKKKPAWDIQSFEKALNETLAQREKNKLSGRKIAHIQLTFPAKILVWGDLGGSFHSLVRSLNWLQSKGIINENLEIAKNDYYLVFNGNAINRSAYILETLTTLLVLLNRNPERIIYLRGNCEDDNAWYDEGLKRELLIRSERRLTNEVPYASTVSKLFNTLPLAFYLSTIKEPSSLIRISPTGLDNAEINEDFFGSFWTRPPTDKIHYYDVTDKKRSTTKVDIKVIVKTENWMLETRAASGQPHDMFGLGLLDQDRGVTAWSVLSSPNIGNQKYLDFYCDAFGMISLESTIEKSFITLFSQNIKDLRGFKQYEPFNVFSGLQLTRKNTARKNFKIGSSLGLIRGVPIMSRQVMRGMSTRIQEANSNDELQNLFLSLTSYNDDYIPYVAHQNIINLVDNYGVDVILLPTGSPTLNAYLDLIKQDKILTLFPITGNPGFFNNSLVGLINYRANYADEVRALLDHVMEGKLIKRFAFFYQDDSYGLDALKAAKEFLQNYKGIKIIEIPYLSGSTDFSKQAGIIKAESPEAIGLFSTALSTREFIRQIGSENLNNKVLFGLSFLAEESIRSYANRLGVNITFAAVVPNPHTSNLPIATAYRKQMDTSKYKYDTFSFEAYIGTSILIDALKKAKKPTRNDIKEYLESLQNYDLDGLKLSFDPERRMLSTKVWIEKGQNEPWIEKNIAELKKSALKTPGAQDEATTQRANADPTKNEKSL